MRVKILDNAWELKATHIMQTYSRGPVSEINELLMSQQEMHWLHDHGGDIGIIHASAVVPGPNMVYFDGPFVQGRMIHSRYLEALP